MTATSPPSHCGARRQRPCVLASAHVGPHQDVRGERWISADQRDTGLFYGVASAEQAQWIDRVHGVYRVPLSTLLVVTPEGLQELHRVHGCPIEHLGRRIELCVGNDALVLWPLSE